MSKEKERFISIYSQGAITVTQIVADRETIHLILRKYDRVE